jgi:hypothetical protein
LEIIATIFPDKPIITATKSQLQFQPTIANRELEDDIDDDMAAENGARNEKVVRKCLYSFLRKNCYLRRQIR